MLNLPKEFCKKYQKLLGEQEAERFFYRIKRAGEKAFRINTLKFNQQVSYSTKEKVAEIPHAYYGKVKGDDPEWVSGSVYSQDPSAMFPAYFAKAKPGQKVLDLCAAPGGKTTLLAEELANQGLLVANEISASRVKVLRENLERFGITNSLITNNDASQLSQKFPQFFDTILVDAPCSGEGMFRKNPDAISYWSQEYILKCQARQKEILRDAVKMLKSGGELVYSTCTFSPEEDEEIIAWLVKEYGFKINPIKVKTPISHGQAEFISKKVPGIENTLRFWPQDNLGEGQFLAILQLPEAVQVKQEKSKKKNKHKKKINYLSSKEKELVNSVLSKFNLPLNLKNWQEIAMVSHDHVYIPVYSGDLSTLKVVNNGVELGLLKKKRFEPGHHLAEVLGQVKQTQQVNLTTNEEYKKYLHGEAFRIKTDLSGFVLVSYHDLIFSFGKVNPNGMLKNFYPKGLRNLK